MLAGWAHENTPKLSFADQWRDTAANPASRRDHARSTALPHQSCATDEPARELRGAWRVLVGDRRIGDVSGGKRPGFWQALLIAGTFRDTSASRGLPLVSGKTITVFDPDGNVLDGGVSAIAQPTEHRIETLTQEQVREIVQRSTTQAGVTAEALAFARLLRRLGVEMVVRTDDPAGFFRNRPLKLSELLGELVGHERPTVEGTYVEVRDRGGRFVTASAYTVRTGEGVGYSSPRFESGTGSGTSPLTGG